MAMIVYGSTDRDEEEENCCDESTEEDGESPAEDLPVESMSSGVETSRRYVSSAHNLQPLYYRMTTEEKMRKVL